MSDTKVISTDLLDLIGDLALKKPQTTADAIKLYDDIMNKVLFWVAAELPMSEKKAFFLAQWTVGEIANSSCFSFIKKNK